MFAELPGPPSGRPPRLIRALRLFGAFLVAAVVVSVLSVDPRPGLEGDRLWVSIGLILLLAGLAASLPYRTLPPGVRFAGLLATGAAACLLTAFQPDGGALALAYVVVVIAALRLPRPASIVISGAVIAAETLIIALGSDHPEGAEFAFLASAIPWFFVMTLVRELMAGRAALAQAAALSERARLARDMHDVLAHSLSALALQLEATRLLARDRGADPEVVHNVERAHHLAVSGLDETRRAIAALRGDELPGLERVEALAEAFAAGSDATCTVTVSGTPRPLDAESGLTLYRAAQEALTNVRRHSDAERVEIDIAYEPDGVALVVSDHAPGAPVAVGADGDGYGLTGMRERAELLGGRLRAEPTGDGFRVELWLPR